MLTPSSKGCHLRRYHPYTLIRMRRVMSMSPFNSSTRTNSIKETRQARSLEPQLKLVALLETSRYKEASICRKRLTLAYSRDSMAPSIRRQSSDTWQKARYMLSLDTVENVRTISPCAPSTVASARGVCQLSIITVHGLATASANVIIGISFYSLLE